MRAWPWAALLTLLWATALRGQSDVAAAYGDWGSVLSRYLSGDHVQYGRWKADDPPEWRRFLAWLEATDPSNLSLAEQRAFWINAYNARVVAGVLEHYPLASVRDVGLFGGRVRGFFDRRKHAVAGRRWTLEEIRRNAVGSDPRTHFALTLAAESGPPLRTEPYRAEALDTQLDFQTRTFLNGPAGHRLEASARRLRLTEIMRWQADTFRDAAGSVRAFAGRYLIGEAAVAAASEDWRQDWLEFDWQLNDVH